MQVCDGPLVTVVGPCGSGKSSLVDLLNARGVRARESSQEHTDMPYYWLRTGPGILVYLHLELAEIRRRRDDPGWPEQRYLLQLRRLAYARTRAHATIDTSQIPLEEVLDRALAALPPARQPAGELRVPLDHATIQAAVDAAADGQTIVVLQGRYHEDIRLVGRHLTLRSQMPSVDDTVKNTVICGTGAGSVITIDGGRVSLMGFTVTGGHGRISAAGLSGGGITVCDGATALIMSNVITGNKSDGDGGGILIRDAAPQIHSNHISLNHAQGEGGGIAVVRDSPRLEEWEAVPAVAPGAAGLELGAAGAGEAGVEAAADEHDPARRATPVPQVAVVTANVLSANTADGSGGGLYLGNVSPRMEDNVIVDNAAERGGAVFVDDNSRPSLTANRMEHNRAQLEGGAVSAGWGSAPALDMNIIRHNRASQGGGLYAWQRSAPRLIRNRLSGNVAPAGPNLLLHGRARTTLLENSVAGRGVDDA